MFASYPGFEELPIRVEVEWRGQTRPVRAQFEQWPYWPQTVLVCTFEDAPTEGEWMLFSGRSLRGFHKPEQRIQSYELAHGESSEPHPMMEFLEVELERLHEAIRRVFSNPNPPQTSIARLIALPELVDEPRLAVETEAGWFWCSDGRDPNFVPFKIGCAPLPVDMRDSQAALRRAWHDESSDARFAWNWALQNDKERVRSLTSFEGDWDWHEIERVMSWVLISASALWKLDGGWLWEISADARHDILEDRSHGDVNPGTILDEWIAFIRNLYVPDWRESLVTNHQCARDFCGSHGCNIGLVQMLDAPTAHEQLEARLALRDWLAQAATPDVAALLLASLEG